MNDFFDEQIPALEFIRANADGPLFLKVVEYLEARLEALKAELVQAKPDNFPHLQGAAREVERIIKEIKTKKVERHPQRDGAYEG
ncbi:MAG: hypothetical protein SVS15_05655 [Thermodesulfobacteriota bacterium]|nr:hypothetical protein [Thermodesulfobacteriota bacterium]